MNTEEHEKLKLESIEALNFLQAHPAYEDRFTQMFWWWPAKVCKRGFSAEDGYVNVWATDEGAEKFKAEFEEEYEEVILDFSTVPKLWHIRAPYEDVYGEPWALDHVEYWWEMCFTVYHGSEDSDSKDWMDEKLWQSYSFDQGGERTFEECIIKLAEATKLHLGDFKWDSFYTEEEKENHQNTSPWITTPCDGETYNPLTERNEKFLQMNDNPAYINVHQGILNRRWLNWFKETDYCKEHWEGSFDKVEEEMAGVSMSDIKDIEAKADEEEE